ncbi:MAG: nucleotidyltransferase domain-containing protein [Patescibacteria group bacterium]
MNDLEKSILATLVYYDVLDRPLTGWEVFKYLIRSKNITLNQVLNVLENSLELNKLISQKNGFYFLKHRQAIIKERIKRHKIANKKWKKARRAIKLFQIIPFIRMVAVSGSLAMNNTKENSDIDLLIIVKSGRIWICRGFITLYSHLIGKRRHGILTKDRFCLNHYLTEKSLKIPYKSLYNAQTYAHLMPFSQIKNNLYKRFQKANQWINEYLTFYPVMQKGYLKEIKSNIFFRDLRELKEFALDGIIGNFIEFILKKIQQTRIKKDPLTYQSGGRVVFSDNQLEFHPNSPEKWILEKYNQKMKKLGFEELSNEKDSGLIL